jgi:ADP-heptose:LPS heptosyltransferase
MKKICIIKLGALGDVVRTLPILEAIKEKFPVSDITWITKQNAKEIIESRNKVNKTLTIPLENIPSEKFDVLYNFDIEEEATSLANQINSKEKKGFYLEQGFVSAFNFPAQYYLDTVFDDELKKSNKKTYQQMMFEAAELDYKKQKIPLNPKKEYAQRFLKENNIIPEKIIGIHMGASSRWPSKKWHTNNLKEFIQKANQRAYKIFLFGGPNEANKINLLYQELKSQGIEIYKQDPHCSILEFASLVDLCDRIVCGDTLCLHIALALNKPTIGLFFCTSFSEVEDYGLLKKLIAPKHAEFFPERSDQYSEELTKSISPKEVLDLI